MIVKKIVPDGWPCTIEECPPGPFVTVFDPHLLCFKSEYRLENGRVMALNSAGEYFSVEKCVVQPVKMVEEEEEV